MNLPTTRREEQQDSTRINRGRCSMADVTEGKNAMQDHARKTVRVTGGATSAHRRIREANPDRTAASALRSGVRHFLWVALLFTCAGCSDTSSLQQASPLQQCSDSPVIHTGEDYAPEPPRFYPPGRAPGR